MRAAYQTIVDQAAAQPGRVPLGVVTTLDRDAWADVRERLVAHGASQGGSTRAGGLTSLTYWKEPTCRNPLAAPVRRVIEGIDDALFLVCLDHDDTEPATVFPSAATAGRFLHGRHTRARRFRRRAEPVTGQHLDARTATQA